jgi:hypothetical protein
MAAREHRDAWQPADAATDPAQCEGEEEMSEHIGKVVRIRDQHGVAAIGMAIAFTDRPVYLIEEAGGLRTIRNYCLTEEATLPEQIDYWRTRAYVAERGSKP